MADQAGVSEAADIDAISAEIVLAEVFTRRLADPVHGCGEESGVLGAVGLWGIGAKDCDGAGPKDTGELFFAGEFQDVQEALGVELPGGLWLPFAGGGEQCRQQINRRFN